MMFPETQALVVERLIQEFEFKERGDKFYFSINRDIVLAYKELTASQYSAA